MADRTIRVRLEAAIGGFQQGMRRASQETRQFGGQVGDTIRRNDAEMTRLGMAATAMGGAILLGLRSATREAVGFESTITKLTTQIGLTRDEAQAMGDAALRMGHTGRGPQELGSALFFAASAGLRGQAALDVVEASAKAASIGLGDTATVTDLLTSAVNAYGPAALSAERATDILIGAVREGKAEAPELAGALGRVLPIAAEMGITFEDVTAAVAAMTRTGTDAATANTQLRAIMVSLLKPAKQSADTLAEFGLSAAEVREAAAGPDGLFGALMLIKDAVGGNDEAMARIFPNVRALAGVLDLLGANASENEQIFARQQDTVGNLADGYAEWGLTTEAAQQRFSAAMEAAKVSLGTTLLPAMMSMLERGTDLVGWFNDLDRGTQQAVGGLLGLSGTMLTTGGIALILAPRILHTVDAMQRLSAATGITRTGVGATSFVLLGLIGTLEQVRRGYLSGSRAAEQMAAEIIASSRSIEEANRRLAESAREQIEETATFGRTAKRAAETGVGPLWQAMKMFRGESTEYRDTVRDLTAGFKLWRESTDDTRQSVFDLTGQVVTGTGPALRNMNTGLSGMADAVRDTHPELAAMIDELEGVGGAADETGDALEGLSDEQKALAAPIDCFPHYFDAEVSA